MAAALFQQSNPANTSEPQDMIYSAEALKLLKIIMNPSNHLNMEMIKNSLSVRLGKEKADIVTFYQSPFATAVLLEYSQKQLHTQTANNNRGSAQFVETHTS